LDACKDRAVLSAQNSYSRNDEDIYTTKEMVTKFKRLPTEWEKIFASYTSGKGLITRIYRKLKKLNFQKLNDPVKKWANELNGAFSRKKSQWPKNT
jgi:beta-glucosidase/6-phospho-beta-glucosidase/beta-galactosidase